MAWGMLSPTGPGEFMPLGDFEGRVEPASSGWRERLKKYYDDQGPEEQKKLYNPTDDRGVNSYPNYVSGKFREEIGTSDGPYGPIFNKVQPHEPPINFETEKRCVSLGSLIELTNRIIAVDSSMKDLLEKYECGVHQFYPIEILMPREAVFEQTYYVLVVGNYNDSWSREDSEEGSWRENGGPGYYAIEKSKSGINGLAVSKAKFGGSHLWRDRHLGSRLICLSDELQSAINDAGLRLPKHYRMKEV